MLFLCSCKKTSISKEHMKSTLEVLSLNKIETSNYSISINRFQLPKLNSVYHWKKKNLRDNLCIRSN